MIRGAIEWAGEGVIRGWIFSPEVGLRGRTLLAFLDGQCVGAGEISVFREDIRDAGLGDGFAGFEFGISLEDEADAPRVVVALDWCDAVLMQKAARVATAPPWPAPDEAVAGLV
ncbi:MAG: hypothetical protein ICV73_10620 [Acetobacteraceae bacterium]|nr:hypothetical protein [Acetobacteraceae bacterium]